MSKGINRDKDVLNFKPTPGILIVDPVRKTNKSDMMAVNDEIDDPHAAYVVCIGDPKPYDSNPSISRHTFVNIGDFISYSIVGCEKIRHPYKGDPRHEFVIVPFERVLGIRGDGNKYKI